MTATAATNGGFSDGNGQLVRSEKTLLVSACGRSVTLDIQSGASIFILQSQLQQSLHMEGQTFQLFDVQGVMIATDRDLNDAILRGQVPLVATLSDSSIHFIENRREELAQMQWKLMRDQVAGTSGKVAELHRTIAEMKEFVETHKKECQAAADRLRLELLGAVENGREVSKGDLMQLAERVNAVSHLLAKERSMRDVATQGVEKQVQGVRDALEADKTLRRKELGTMSSLVDDCKKTLEADARSRERFEDRYAQDTHKLNDRLEGMSQLQAEENQDLAQLSAKMRHEVDQSLQACSRQVSLSNNEMEQVASEARANVKTIEDRLGNLEARHSEAVSRQTAKFDLINGRSDKVAQALDQARMGERRQGAGIDTLAGKVQELEQSLRRTDSEARELCVRERQAREQSLRSTQMAIVAKQEGDISDLEQKFLLRRDRDSEATTDRMGNSVEFQQVPASVRKPFSIASSPSRARLDATVSQSPMRVLSPPQRVMSSQHLVPQVVARSPPRGPVPVQIQAEPTMVTASMPAGWWGGQSCRAR